MKSKEELTALHEASHAIIAKLFPDSLKVKAISLNPRQDFKKHSSAKNWKGVNRIGFKKYKKPTEFSLTALIITFWAGFVGQNIAEYGVDFIDKNKDRFLTDPGSFNTDGIEDDLKVIQQYSPLLAKTRKVTAAEHQMFCNSLLVDYFIDRKAWVYVEKFAKKLLTKKNKKVGRLQILLIFISIGYLSYLRKIRVTFLTEYFNLSKAQKRYYWFRRYF